MTSYRRITSRALNRNVNTQSNIDTFLNSIGKGIYPRISSANNLPTNSIMNSNNNALLVSNGTNNGIIAQSKLIFNDTKLEIMGDLDVIGEIYGGELTVNSGNVIGKLDVSGDIIGHTNLDITGDINTITGSIISDHNVVANNDVIANNNVVANNDIHAKHDVSVDNNLLVSGRSDISGALNVFDDLNVHGNFLYFKNIEVINNNLKTLLFNESNTTYILNNPESGIDIYLPTGKKGVYYEFISGATPDNGYSYTIHCSNNERFATYSNVLLSNVLANGVVETTSFNAQSDSNCISMNGTSTGGGAGSTLNITAVGDGIWYLNGNNILCNLSDETSIMNPFITE